MQRWGRRESDHGWHVAPEGEEREGWWRFDGTVPVLATHLGHLKAKGPHGPIWWRFGRAEWQTLTDAGGCGNPTGLLAVSAERVLGDARSSVSRPKWSGTTGACWCALVCVGIRHGACGVVRFVRSGAFPRSPGGCPYLFGQGGWVLVRASGTMCLCMLMIRLARVSLRSSRCFSGTPATAVR